LEHFELKIMKIYYIVLFFALWSCHSTTDLPDAFGHFEADDVLVASEVNGKIIILNAMEGNAVKQGDTLAIIDTTQLYLRKKQIEAGMVTVKAKLRNISNELAVFEERQSHLEKEYQRVLALVADGAATTKQKDDLDAEISVVKQQIKTTRTRLQTANEGILSELQPLQAQIDIVDDQLRRSVIRSPRHGTVLDRYVEPGEITAFGKPMIKIAGLEELYLRSYFSGEQLGRLKLGGKVSVLTDGPEGLKEYSGTVSWISGTAEFTPKTVQTRNERINLMYAVKIKVSNDGGLKIGMPGEVFISEE